MAENNEYKSPCGSQLVVTVKRQLLNDGAIEPVEGNNVEGEARMTKAKWLACFALGLSYTTAFQQGIHGYSLA
jgi:hypothetical protein